MSIQEYSAPQILFIKGVFIRDCVPTDDIFEQRFMDRIVVDDPIIKYDTLPSVFVNIDTWVKRTSIKCWHCDLSFDSRPVFIPKIIERASNNSDYSICTHGCFCSFGCAAAFNNIHNSKICDNIRIGDMIKFLYKVFNGRSTRDILPAPSKYDMQSYGGSMGVSDYKALIYQLTAKQASLEHI